MPKRIDSLIMGDGDPERESKLVVLRESPLAGEESGIAPPGLLDGILARIRSRSRRKVANLDTPPGPA